MTGSSVSKSIFMEITLVGFIWITSFVAVIIVNCFKDNGWKQAAGIFLCSMVFQCNNFMVLGGTAVGIQIVSASALCVIMLLRKKTPYRLGILRIGRRFIPNMNLLLFLFEIAFLTTVIVSGVYKTSFLNVLMIIIYLTVAMEFVEGRMVFTQKRLDRIEDMIVITIFTVGILQILCKIGALPINNMLKTLIYNDDDPNVIFNTKPLAVFYSTFMEPSYCGAVLVGFWACYAGKDRNRKNTIISVGLIIAIFLTRSTTAYVGLAFSVGGLFFLKAKNRFYKYALPLLIVTGVVLLLARGDLMNEVLFEKMNTASYRVRSNWNKWALVNFLSSPYFGIGYGRSRASSLLLTLLAELGLIGTLPYLFLVLYMVWVSFKDKREPIIRSHAYMVLCIMACQFIACPDLNFSPFWLSIFLFGLSMRV